MKPCHKDQPYFLRSDITDWRESTKRRACREGQHDLTRKTVRTSEVDLRRWNPVNVKCAYDVKVMEILRYTLICLCLDKCLFMSQLAL